MSKNKEKIEIVIDFYLNLLSIKHNQVKDHSIRVGKLSEKIGLLLDKDSYACYVAGTLHDIGKLVLPSNLFDGHNINEDEYNQVKEHVFLSYEILKNDFLFTALVSSMHHAVFKHGYGLDWFDFPKNLSNETIKKILDIATIVSICDFTDAFLNRKTVLKENTESDLKTLLYTKYKNDKNIVDIVLKAVNYNS